MLKETSEWELKWTFAQALLMLYWDYFPAVLAVFLYFHSVFSLPLFKQGLMGEGRPREATLGETDPSAHCNDLYSLLIFPL